MSKFNVGDRVKITDGYDYRYTGFSGTIVSPGENRSLWADEVAVRIDKYDEYESDDDFHHVPEKNLIALETKFRIGDRVQIDTEGTHIHDGKTGTVVNPMFDMSHILHNTSVISVKIDGYTGYTKDVPSHLYHQDYLIPLKETEVTPILRIGDRVRITDKGEEYYNRTGTVVKNHEKLGVCVRLDNYHYLYDDDGHAIRSGALERILGTDKAEPVHTDKPSLPALKHLESLFKEYIISLETVETAKERARKLRLDIDEILSSDLFDVKNG